MMKAIELTPRDEARFWKKVDKSGECWEWTASTQGAGYGQFFLHLGGKYCMTLAHRVAFRIATGRNAEHFLDHTCHNRTCVNPDHLREVTNKQNSENQYRPNKNNSSGVRGVYWNKQQDKWHAVVWHNRHNYHAGFFDDLLDAEAAVIAKRLELFTHNDKDKRWAA